MVRHAPRPNSLTSRNAPIIPIPIHPKKNVYNIPYKYRSLRSKLDNTKHSSFLTELLIYCLYVNPMLVTQSEIENKILYLCVEKYQHTKIRSIRIMYFCRKRCDKYNKWITSPGKLPIKTKIIFHQINQSINLSLNSKCLLFRTYPLFNHNIYEYEKRNR